MSADNCIAILHTKERFKITDYYEGQPSAWANLFDNPIDVWRVVHTQGIDNFDWYEQNQLYMLGKYMVDVWGKSPVFYDENEALKYADELEAKVKFTEYGQIFIDGTKYDLSMN